MTVDAAIHIALTGDVMPQTALIRANLTEASQQAYELLRQADIGFINLECPVTRNGFPADKLVTLRTDPDLINDLKGLGASVATLANNHVLDYGTEGLADTIQTLQQQSFPYVGIGMNINEALAPHVQEAKGQRIAFMGIASTLAPNSAASELRPGAAPIQVFTRYVVDTVTIEENPGIVPYVETTALEQDIERVEQAVTEAKRQADLLVIGIHWGVPNGWVGQFQSELADYQRPLAFRLIDAGADIIAGHHPHVLHGIEWHKKRPIFYSLGNFLFHRLQIGKQPDLRRLYPPYNWRSLRSPLNLDSVLAQVTLTPSNSIDVQLTPVRLNAQGEPEIADEPTARRIADRLKSLSESFGTRIERTQQGAVVAMPPTE